MTNSIVYFYYRGLDGVIRKYAIPPVYFSHSGFVPSAAIFSGYMNSEYLIMDGVIAN